jgi:Na+-driven multidrug efflux pump
MAPIYPIFFISNALIQGLKKANIVMFLTIGRMVVMPIITLTYLIFYLESSFEYVFWSLLVINWVFGIFIFILTKYLIEKELKNLKLNVLKL